jgi:DNA-binding MarR family transcriptional regulator
VSGFTHENASRAPYLPLLRAMVRAYQGFIETSGRHVRELGLTPSQFDVVATLGNTPGMTLGELSTRTLITKSALTGIIDRLEAQGLVARCDKANDRRCVLARLTPEGEALFREVFPAHVNYMSEFFDRMSAEDQAECRRAFEKVGALFQAGPGPSTGDESP